MKNNLEKSIKPINWITEQKIHFIITFIFLICTSFVAFVIADPPASHDLLFYYYAGKEILSGNGENVRSANGPVGWPIFIASVDSLIHDPFITDKLISVISASAIVLISYYIIKNIFGYKVAILGQILIAINPFLHSESIIAHNDMLALFFIFASFYFITKKQLLSKDIIFCSIFLGLSFMLRYPALFVAIGVFVFLLFVLKRIPKRYLIFFILFFLVTISPLLLFNLSTYGSLVDSDPFTYLAMESHYQNQKFQNLVVKDTNIEHIAFGFFNSADTIFTNYLYNLFYNNPHRILNLGLGWDNFAPLPLVPFNGIVFVLGGALGVLIYKINRMQIMTLLSISVGITIFLASINQIKFYFLSAIIIPIIIIGILSIKKIQTNVLALLITSSSFFLLIAIIPIHSPWYMFSILIAPPALTAFFILNVIPRIFSKPNLFAVNSSRLLKILLLLLISMIIISNLLFSYAVEKYLLFHQMVTYKNIFEPVQNSELIGLEYKQVGDILSKEPDIENKYIMASSLTYAYYANSKFVYAEFTEGNENDTINSFITRTSWSDYALIFSNVNSNPPDRNNVYKPIPDYIVYKKFNDSNEIIKVLADPKDPRIPKNFELLYFSNKTGTVVYKINHDR